MSVARRLASFASIAVAASLWGGCGSLLGDFTVSDAISGDASADDGGATATVDATANDATANDDATNDGASEASPLDASSPCGPTQLLCGGACVDNDAQHCGSCSTTCPSSAPKCAASNGSFGCVSDCPAATPTQCGSACVSTTTDPAHCGNCATTCAAPGATSTATCTNGVCGYACAATLTDCGHGVCVDLSKDPAHCGQCAKSCADATPRTVCAASQCVCPSSTPTYCAATNACVDTQKDAANCGACGHACQGGQCVAGQCQAVVMATITTPGAGLAVDGTSAYFSDGNGGHLYKCDVANCQATTVALANGLANATDVYYDAGTKTVFVIDAGNGTITAVTTTGAKKWTATGLTAPHGMASDGTSLFFANNGTPFTSISFVPLTTGTPVTANNINVEYPPNGGLAFSAASDSFLVVENRATGQIIQCPHKGGGGSNCSNTLGADYSLGIVTGGSYFYFTAKGSSAADSGIYYGSSFPQTQPLAVGASYATSTSPPTADATYAYWGSDAGTVWRVKVGGTPVAIATGQGALTALANDAVAVYWIGANKQLVKVAK